MITSITAPGPDDQPSIDDLRLLVKEIKSFWQMGDNTIVPEARTALWRVLRRSAKRLRQRDRARTLRNSS